MMSMLSIPSRYWLTVKPLSSVCSVCADILRCQADGAGAILIDFKLDSICHDRASRGADR